jgi:hypothetical protein
MRSYKVVIAISFALVALTGLLAIGEFIRGIDGWGLFNITLSAVSMFYGVFGLLTWTGERG